MRPPTHTDATSLSLIPLMLTSTVLLSRRRMLAAATAAAAACLLERAHSQPAYPTRPITVIVPYAPGGQGDLFARLVGERLARALGQAMVVDNRPGASGALGARLAA